MMFWLVSRELRDMTKGMLRFKAKYAVWDNDYHPPAFLRDDESRVEPTEPIPVTLKRTGVQEIEGEPLGKRAKVD
jgi:hypothetical protein